MEKHIQLYMIVLGLLGAVLGSIFYLILVIASSSSDNSISQVLLSHWQYITKVSPNRWTENRTPLSWLKMP